MDGPVHQLVDRKEETTCSPVRPPQESATLAGWLHLASDRVIVRRAFGYAVVVGAILITINHGGAIFTGQIDGPRIAKMALTVVVPYVVSTLSSIGAIRGLRR